MLACLYDAMRRHNVEVSAFSTRKLWSETWEVWHLHWPKSHLNDPRRCGIALKLLKFFIQLKMARFKKTKIFWTAHNIRRHERDHPLLERILWRIFIPNLDGIICMSERGRSKLYLEHSRTRTFPIIVIPHGHYRGVYPDTISKDEAREALQIRADDFILAFIGQISPVQRRPAFDPMLYSGANR